MEGYMTDSKGRLVPSQLVPEIDKIRDELVKAIVKGAVDARAILHNFKNHVLGEVNAFVDLSLEKYGVEWGGNKGNISLLSFDGMYKVQVAISEYLNFDERLQAAKKLIDECLTRWTEGSRSELKVLVNDAFQVDKQGKINTGRILSLRRLEIADETWEKAMQAISDSLQVVGSKTYIRVYQRQEPDGRWEPVSLDVAAV
ncbi:MAG: DUF3164 family protein [Candidatus Omnitrophica bacterium]|nr:DUF3164 family protein [Candidatus Omnitrophota bacterium]